MILFITIIDHAAFAARYYLCFSVAKIAFFSITVV